MKNCLLLLLLFFICINFSYCDIEEPDLDMDFNDENHIGLFTSNKQVIKMTNIQSSAYIENSHTTVQHTQEYENPNDQETELYYYCNKHPTAIVHKFEAFAGEKNVALQVIDKASAVKQYESKVSQTSSISTSKKATRVSDTKVRFYIGKVAPKQKVTVKYSVIQPLQLVANQFYSFSLYSTMTSNYDFYNYAWNKAPDYSMTCLKNSDVKSWNVDVTVASNLKYQDVLCPTHQTVKPMKTTENNTHVVKYNMMCNTSQDVAIYYNHIQMSKPKTVIAKHPAYKKDYVTKVEHIPKITTATKKIIKTQILTGKTHDEITQAVYNLDRKTVKGEYVFVLDCTNALTHTRFQIIKQSVIRFFNSLPDDCYFNIITYGSSVKHYSTSSVKFTAQSLHQVLTWITTLNFASGATADVYHAVKAATSLELKSEYPRTIHVYASAESKYHDKVVAHTYANSNKMRVCGCGVGTQGSKYLVDSIGNAGNCRSWFFNDNDHHTIVSTKTDHVVKHTCSHQIQKVQHTCNCYDTNHKLVKKQTNYQSYWFKDWAFDNYFHFEDITPISYCRNSIKYYNTFYKKFFSYNYVIDNIQQNTQNNDCYHQVAYNQEINNFELKSLFYYNFAYNYNALVSLKDIIKEACVKYQVASDYTTYVSAQVSQKLYTDQTFAGGYVEQVPIVTPYVQTVPAINFHEEAQIEVDSVDLQVAKAEPKESLPCHICAENSEEQVEYRDELEQLPLGDLGESLSEFGETVDTMANEALESEVLVGNEPEDVGIAEFGEMAPDAGTGEETTEEVLEGKLPVAENLESQFGSSLTSVKTESNTETAEEFFSANANDNDFDLDKEDRVGTHPIKPENSEESGGGSGNNDDSSPPPNRRYLTSFELQKKN